MYREREREREREGERERGREGEREILLIMYCYILLYLTILPYIYIYICVCVYIYIYIYIYPKVPGRTFFPKLSNNINYFCSGPISVVPHLSAAKGHARQTPPHTSGRPPPVRPIALRRLSLLRFVDSKFPGNSPWT